MKIAHLLMIRMGRKVMRRKVKKKVMKMLKHLILVSLQPPDKSVYWKTIFFISHPKHMLWVLKRTVSMRRFF